MKVLIAEDDSTSAIVLRKALEKLGHEAIVANDGEAAYAILSNDTGFVYRVVISDWMMPGMDGLELTRKLRAERKPGDPYRFVVLLTARGRPEDRRQGLDAGADDFMVKPLDMGDLIPRLSIAARMIALEDAVLNQAQGVPAVTPPIPAVETTTSPVAAEAIQGKAEASAIVLAAIEDHQSSELYFEPQKDRTCRIRIRVPGGKLRLLSVGTNEMRLAQQYFLSQTSQIVSEFSVEDRVITVETKVLTLKNRGNHIYVRVVNDTEESKTVTTLDDVPMHDSIRRRLQTYLVNAKHDGGALFVKGSPTDRSLVARTVAAIRQELADDSLLILSTSEAVHKLTNGEWEALSNVGIQVNSGQPASTHSYFRVMEQQKLLDKIIEQEPDVIIAEELSLSVVHSLDNYVAAEYSFKHIAVVSYTGPERHHYYQPAGWTILSVLPMSYDNVQNRFQFEQTSPAGDYSKNDDEDEIFEEENPEEFPPIDTNEIP